MTALDARAAAVNDTVRFDRQTDALGTKARVGSWALQLVAAGIMGQTLFFKFTGAPEAVAIFETLGVEPVGRIGSGVIELVAVVLLLVPRTIVLGALLTVGIMVGAIGSHLGPLGIEVGGDGGSLFAMAIVTLLAGVGVLAIRRRRVATLVGRARRVLGR